MLQVDASLFANVATSLQRTSSLTGGAVRGLPNGVVLEGLRGVSGFGSDITEAQKEFELGRVRTSLERIKQIEMQFNGIVGRWNATAGGILSAARQGQQKMSIQKLNEVKNAQTKMQQLTNPAVKAFRDLVSALEHAVTQEGRQNTDSDPAGTSNAASKNDDSAEAEKDSEEPSAPDVTEQTKAETTMAPEQPSTDLLGHFAANYTYGRRLKVTKHPSGKSQLTPAFQNDQFYLLAGTEPPRVVRIRERSQSSLIVFDTHSLSEALIEMSELKDLLRQGIWELVKS